MNGLSEVTPLQSSLHLCSSGGTRESEVISLRNAREGGHIVNGYFVDHASSICGSTTKPIVMTVARNCISATVYAVFTL